MPVVILEPLDFPALALLSDDPDGYAEREHVLLGASGPLLRRIAAQTQEWLAARSAAAQPWGSFLGVNSATRQVVGTCAFKAPPDAEGMVEIAYFIFPPHEGHGYATAMASALRERASASGVVRTVRAHTLPERNASVRILEKLGFAPLGEVMDPEDGSVWRWEWPVPGGATDARA